jgi:MoxR-like ATPase
VTAIIEALCLAIQASVPCLLWGDPGVGKSSAVRSIGEALGLPVKVVIASIREPSDFAGLPVVNDGSVTLAPPG